MSFFGFDATLPERRRGLDDDLDAFGDKAGAEDIAVYTWGTEAYDGLGDQLQEQGDDTNDTTFGGGDIGESLDFRFASCLGRLEGAHPGLTGFGLDP
jgi:DNA topoisomerase 2-associated protein PAT1